MYKSEFEKAVLRTKEFNLICPEIIFSEGVLLTHEKMQKFPYVLRDTVGEIGVEEVVAQCLSIHYRLADVIAELFDTACYFTIGYVETVERLMFHQSEQDLKTVLQSGVNGSSLNIHAWLTLPTMEIMDFSLPTSYAILNKKEEGIGGLIATHADTLTGGMKYHPMLVGEDFLRKSGGLVEFGI
ncbi:MULTISPECIES: hypothetical protein [unclassified Oleiphilus]|uniref:hypothetical protein n=1 Tax=unclassified Oleiphilus TaxID=2631174 RepID=UPI0007C3AF94|nr:MULTISPECIES: hypothetical protein [unclassified Oleiphilus]KZY66774.1 hypothetical protein A3738_16430 [Oleiphilus sp. HI0066]KZY68540.1 hypothetical protein A3739_11040 [Oleiphilus sp. HI0067]KZY71757.1 hypothetical protein A3738_03620 [Oleiphilus sp. HI0066]KZY75129.1 hypothetical protein A3739_24645 [Oleiphilus sp. HI0067]